MYHVQNFMPIGATVAEIPVTGQRKTQKPI